MPQHPSAKPHVLAMRRLALLLVSALAAFALVPAGPAAAKPKPPPVELQFLNISDFHGQLDPLSINGQQVGGAAVLSAYFEATARRTRTRSCSRAAMRSVPARRSRRSSRTCRRSSG
jgi:hypothetical protein